MSARELPGVEVEPERYELAEGPAYRFGVARRDLFRAVGGGLLVFAAMPAVPSLGQQESGGSGRRGGGGQGTPQEIGAWLHVGEDGAVTVYTGKVEVGQNARTSLAQAVAEELRLNPDSVRLVMGDTDLCPYDAGTFGSRTTPAMAPQLRRAAVAARETLANLAAERLKVERAALTVADGRVSHPATDRSVGFGELTKGRKLTETVGEAGPLTPAAEWKVAGTSVPKANGRDIVTGRHRYTSDMARPGMLYGKVVRPPQYGAKLVSVDDAAARKLPGVTVVRDGEFLGVVAPSTPAAEAAAEALVVKWEAPAGPQPSSKELFGLLKSTSEPGGGGGGRGGLQQGDVASGLASATKKVEASYTVAYIAHVPLEPRAALAEWEGEKLTVWTGTQRPFGVRGELASAFGVPEARVRVIVPDTGSGYGGKHTGECAVEAARLAKAAGKPVKLVWSREEEFAWAYFRPAGLIEVKAGVGADGRLTAWDFHNYNSGTAAIRSPYEAPHQNVAFHGAKSPLRQGSYRGLAATANHFAREVHIDELALAAGADPLEFRRKNTKDERLLAVLEAAATAFGWGKAKAPAGRGYGLAGGIDKGGFVANCVEVSVDPKDGRVKIERIVTAFECGAIVHPDHLQNQVEGAIVQAIGGALFEAVEFGEGRIVNPRLSEYRVPRFRDIPPLTTVLLDRKDLPSAGAGECPICALAPAVGNALFAATGVRLRSLPLVPGGRLKRA